MSDTCSLFPPFGDPWPSCLLPSHWDKKSSRHAEYQAIGTPWTITHYVPLSMGFSRQEYWSGLPFPSPGDLPNSGMKPVSPALPV